MASEKISGILFYLLISFMIIPGITVGQEVRIDTSEYMPEFYSNAINYNLTIAASKGYDSEIRRLVDRGADIEFENSEGATPLIYAVANSSPEAVNALLELGADPDKVTSDFQTPLLIAVKTLNSRLQQETSKSLKLDEKDFKYNEVAEALIRAGADIDYADSRGATALNYAAIYGLFYFADMLLYYRADIDKKARDGTTPLMAAVWSGHADLADLLIQSGANLEARDNEGFTPFLIAAQNCDTVIMEMLLDNGIELYEYNSYGWSALDLVIKSNVPEAAKYLIRKGDKWNSQQKDAINPYSVAAKYSRKEMINILNENNLRQGQRARIDQMAVALTSRFTFHDYYAGFSFTFKDPLIHAGFIAGFDTKPWYSKLLIRESNDLYVQYKTKNSLVYGGVFKDIQLTKNIFRGNWFAYGSLSCGYSFGTRMKGTDSVPANEFRFIPGAGLKCVKNNFIFFTGVDFTRTEYFSNGPIWIRLGIASNFYFDNVRAPGKIIRWY